MSRGAAPLTPVLVRMLEGRVGSTAIMQLLASSAEVALDRAYPFQNSYLTYFVRLTGQIARPLPTREGVVEVVYQTDQRLPPLPFGAQMFNPEVMATETLAAVWAAFSKQVLDRSPGARYYAEKYWGDLNSVLSAGLRPVVIHLVRDPRDIIVSVRAFNHRHAERFFGRPLAADDRRHLKHLVLGMALRFKELDAKLPVPTLTVRYEDLVTEPEGCAAELEALLGTALDVTALRADQAVLDRHVTAASVQQSVGRWRTELSPEDQAFIEMRLGASMRQWGYLN